MHKLLVLYPHPADQEHFETYYRAKHLPLASRIPGVVAARYSLQVTSEADKGPYFAVFEADFVDAQSMQAAMASEWGLRVVADVPNYASSGAVVIDYAVEPLALEEQADE